MTVDSQCRAMGTMIKKILSWQQKAVHQFRFKNFEHRSLGLWGGGGYQNWSPGWDFTPPPPSLQFPKMAKLGIKSFARTPGSYFHVPVIISCGAEGLGWEILQRPPPPPPSVCPSVTFSFRTVTQKRIDVFSRNFAGMCTMCCIVFDIDGMLFEFFKYWKKIKLNFFQYFMFSSRFMLFPTLKKKFVKKKFRRGGGGGGGVLNFLFFLEKNNSFSCFFCMHFTFYPLFWQH